MAKKTTAATKIAPKPAPKKPAAKKQIRHEVETDEPRERLGNGPETIGLQTSEGIDALAEELGEEFVENVTGADDAASEHRERIATEELGGPFVITAPAIEFGAGTDRSNPPSATREPLPRASAARP